MTTRSARDEPPLAAAVGTGSAPGGAAARPPELVETTAELERCCRDWRHVPALGVDTEFVRERTFYPGLGLIQVCDGDRVFLIDTVAIEDLEPLRTVLSQPEVIKVFHSCSEDLEVLYHRFSEMPQPLFDTQIAAAFLGLGYSIGYGRLVHRLFGLELPKSATRTDWLRRPLTEIQKEYAALDVAYLLPAHDFLRQELRARGRESWAQEEVDGLRDTRRFLPDPDTLYRQHRQARALSRRELGILRALYAWREQEARQRNLPRNFVIQQAPFPTLARKQPRNLKAVAACGLDPRELQRYGRTLLRLIAEVRELPEDELPPEPERRIDLARYRRQIDRMRQAVAATARELDLPAELLASRKTLEAFARRVIAGKEPPLPKKLRGWRRAVIGERLLEIMTE